jgi:hypothetical protein
MRSFSLVSLFLPAFWATLALGVDHARVAEHLRRGEENTCANEPSALARRDDGSSGVGVGASVGANVALPSVGLSLGNITTKIGNINLTVTNVTIATGDIECVCFGLRGAAPGLKRVRVALRTLLLGTSPSSSACRSRARRP